MVPCDFWFGLCAAGLGEASYKKTGARKSDPRFRDISRESSPSLGGLLFFLCLRLLAFALSELRQLGHELFRVFVECLRTMLAAEVNLLVLVFHNLFRLD